MDKLSALKNIDWRGDNVKLAVAFLVPFFAGIVLAPGAIFEYTDNGFRKEKRISWKTAALHALILAILVVLVYYFYLRK